MAQRELITASLDKVEVIEAPHERVILSFEWEHDEYVHIPELVLTVQEARALSTMLLSCANKGN